MPTARREKLAAGGGSSNGRRMDRLRLDALDVRGVEPLRTALDLELHHLTLGERLEAFHRDRGEVDEHVLSALLLNEAIALGVIEPLHLASGHTSCLQRDVPDPALRGAGHAQSGVRAPI